MPTTQEEKPAKPRSRSRKAAQKTVKAEATAQIPADQVSVEAEPVSAMIAAAIEAAAAEVAQAEMMPAEMAHADVAPNEVAPAATVIEEALDTASIGEQLAPEMHKPEAAQAASLSAIALVYGDYTRKSWAAGRVFVERLIASRSFEEAIEVQGEFAKQAYANFVAQSQKVCVLYGEWAQQLFRPYERLATEGTRAGRWTR